MRPRMIRRGTKAWRTVSHVRIQDQLDITDEVEAAACLLCGQTYTDRYQFQHLIGDEVVGNLCKACAPADYVETIVFLEQQAAGATA